MVAQHRDAIVEQRFLFGIGPLMNAFRDGDWRWADGAKTKAALDAAFAALVGEGDGSVGVACRAVSFVRCARAPRLRVCR